MSCDDIYQISLLMIIAGEGLVHTFFDDQCLPVHLNRFYRICDESTTTTKSIRREKSKSSFNTFPMHFACNYGCDTNMSVEIREWDVIGIVLLRLMITVQSLRSLVVAVSFFCLYNCVVVLVSLSSFFIYKPRWYYD